MASQTPNMDLSTPDSGDSDYPTSVSSSFTKIDLHDHTTGKGVQVPTGGIVDLAVTAAKLAANSVTTAKILDANVTTAKILDANVTRAKLVAVGQQVSADVNYTGSATTYTDVTNATVTITTTGRPVVIALIPNTTGDARISMNTAAPSNAAIDVKVLRDATKAFEAIYLGLTLQLTTAGPAGSPLVVLPASSVYFIDAVAAGTYVYKIQAQKAAGVALSVTDYTFVGRLLAYEL